MIRTGAALLATILLAGCAAGGADPSGLESSRPEQTPNVDPVPSGTEAPVIGEVPQELLDRILADAEDRTGVSADEIVVTMAQETEWSDGSLGCPEPGMMYTQAIEPGYHLILDADGEDLDYRATVRGLFRLCEDPEAPLGG